MKKNLLKFIFVTFLGMAIGYNVYSTKNNENLSDLALNNIEALASSESGGFSCRWNADWTSCSKNGSGLGCPCGSDGW